MANGALCAHCARFLAWYHLQRKSAPGNEVRDPETVPDKADIWHLLPARLSLEQGAGGTPSSESAGRPLLSTSRCSLTGYYFSASL